MRPAVAFRAALGRQFSAAGGDNVLVDKEPWYFVRSGAEAFHDLQLVDSDVIHYRCPDDVPGCTLTCSVTLDVRVHQQTVEAADR